MCGIFGYVGHRPAFGPILEGLGRLEYRGYDSAGVALIDDGKLVVRRVLGGTRHLVVGDDPGLRRATAGIGHTRWATHGLPSVANAHPHVDCTDTVAVVHNGIIENHAELRAWLVERGHRFSSQTDTEVVSHLIEEHAGGGLETAVRKAVDLLRGDFALAVVSREAPGVIAAVRCGHPPLLVGLGDGEHFLASDAVALSAYTRDILAVEDGEVTLLSIDGPDLTTPRRAITVDWSPTEAERDGHAHFMHKEIHEQPAAVRRTLAGRVSVESDSLRLDGVGLTPRQWRELHRVILVGCGTSNHAGLLGRWFFERIAHIPADADISSEFRYRDPLVGPGDLAIFISQSGETADTLGAVRVARARGARTIAICNVPGSSLTRAAHGVVMTATGPEIGVASTKAFTAQVSVLFLLAVLAGRARGTVDAEQGRALLSEVAVLPAKMEELLADEPRVQALAARFEAVRDVFFLGRGPQYPLALEGALKLKEIAYVRAEAFAAGEMKHGPLALVDESTVTIVLAPAGSGHTKMVSTIEEVKARRGRVIALCTTGDATIPALADAALLLPTASEHLLPCLAAVPLQLFAYHMAVRRGCDVDRPRNLAKSVTVE